MRKYPLQSMRHGDVSRRRLLCDDDAASNQSISERSAVSSLEMTKIKMPGLATSSLSTSSSASSAAVNKRKVDELFRRIQPHSLIQSMEKLLATLRITPRLFVNGEDLLPMAPPGRSVAIATEAGSKRPTSSTAGWRFHPEAGRFRYGLSLQYTNSNPKLTLSSLEDLSVMITSSAMPSPRCLPLASDGTLSTKAWKLVAETDRRIDLALYELVLGGWGASSLIALVWTQNREVTRFYLQLNTTELLYSAPPRALQVRNDDDLDRAHGLHSYTAAISLRSLDELYWEREVYQVEFPLPENGARNLSVQLLDNDRGGTVAARDRVLTSNIEPAFRLETEVVKYALDNCLVVDFTLWDAECVPVWAFSRALKLKPASSQQDEDDHNIDLSVSSLGGTTRRMQMQYQDATRGNNLVVSVTKLSPPSTPQQPAKRANTWVNQVHLTLSLKFINATFGTKY